MKAALTDFAIALALYAAFGAIVLTTAIVVANAITGGTP